MTETSTVPGTRTAESASWSVAARMTAGYAVVSFALLAILGAVLDNALSSSLDVQLTESARQEAEEVTAILREHPEGIAELREELARSQDADAALWVRVLDARGTLLVETPRMQAQGLSPDRFPEPSRSPAGWQAGRQVILASGAPARTFATFVSAHAGPAPSQRIQVAVDSSEETAILATFRRRLVLALAAVFGALSLVGYLIARAGMNPVRDIVATMTSVRVMPLPQRVDPRGLPSELGGLAVAFNDVLERLDQSFLRLAQFSADIAHELRVPLNRITLQAEVTLQKQRSEQEYRDVLASCVEEGLKLSRLIERLLFLARSEDSLLGREAEQLDLSREIATLVEFYSTPAGESGIELRDESAPGIRAAIDRDLLQSAVGNLVENALAYTPAGGSITLAAVDAGPVVRISVRDTGCGIPAEEVPHLFDALHRVDRARSTASGGAGLGLAIVKKIARLYGGDVEVLSVVDLGTTVTLTLARKTSKSGAERSKDPAS